MNIQKTIKIKLESTNIPFPQADVFGRILDMLLEIHSKDQFSQRDIEINYGLVTRQAQYYASAAIYLGFIQREKVNTGGVGYSLTKLGSKIIQQPSKERNIDLVKCILEKKVFNKALEVYINQNGKLDRVDIIEIMKFEDIQLVRGSQETVSRRADTVRGWINWILRLTQPSQGELPW